MSALEKAHRLKKQAFAALDRSKTGSTVRVDYNELIDVCLAFEEAAKGDTENLEFANAILGEQVRQFRRILDRIADNVPVDSPAWKLCFSEYAPEFNVDPDACLAKIRGKEVDKDVTRQYTVVTQLGKEGSKMTTPTMNEIITEMARYVKDSGFSVDWNRSMGWVAIHDNEENDDTFFLENEDADSFIAEANNKADEADVDLETGMLAQAKQYIDCL